MGIVHAGKSRITAVGLWLIEDPRRIMAAFTLLTVLVAVLLVTTGLAQAGTLVGPTSTGGSGGG
jgi:hypothetical protein